MKRVWFICALWLAGCSSTPSGVPSHALTIRNGDAVEVASTIKRDMQRRGYQVEDEEPGMLALRKSSFGGGFMAGLVPSTASTRLVTVFIFTAEAGATRVQWSSEWRTHMPDGKDVSRATATPAAIVGHMQAIKSGLEKPAV